MILSTIPGMVVLAHSEIRAVFRFFSCFACGPSHARLGQFFFDTGKCRFVQFLLSFFLHRASVMISRPKYFRSIQNGANKPCHTPHDLGRRSCPRVPAKVNAQVDAAETERTRPARITLSLRTIVQQTASG